MQKAKIFIIVFSIIFLVLLAFIGFIRFKLSRFYSSSPQYGPWLSTTFPKENSKTILKSYNISNATTFPLKIHFPLGSISVISLFYGKDIWTKDNLPIPGVTVKEGDNEIKADFGFGIILENGEKLRYASFRTIRPDGLFDERIYKILGEKVIKSTNNDLEKTEDVIQYRLESDLLNIINPIIKVNIISEEITKGQQRSIILQ